MICDVVFAYQFFLMTRLNEGYLRRPTACISSAIFTLQDLPKPGMVRYENQRCQASELVEPRKKSSKNEKKNLLSTLKV